MQTVVCEPWLRWITKEASQWTLGVTAVNDFNESAAVRFVLEVLNLFEPPVNYPPSDLSAPNGLVVKQKQPIGTVVGTFEVFDLNDSGFHAFELVGGEGSLDNALFTLDLNGTLRNASVMNYYQNKSFSIRVRVTDSWYLSYEESFIISYVAVEGASGDVLSDGAEIGAGWRKADWFGTYFGSFYPWVFHENLGWLHVFQNPVRILGFTMKDWVGYGLINTSFLTCMSTKDPIGSFLIVLTRAGESIRLLIQRGGSS